MKDPRRFKTEQAIEPARHIIDMKVDDAYRNCSEGAGSSTRNIQNFMDILEFIRAYRSALTILWDSLWLMEKLVKLDNKMMSPYHAVIFDKIEHEIQDELNKGEDHVG